jgi:hypothetical protein
MKPLRYILLISLLQLASIANAQDFKVIKDTTDYILKEVEKLSLDSLITLKDQLFSANRYDSTKKVNYESLILICNQIKKINRKAAKEEHVDYFLSYSYYRIKQYDKAIEYSKIYRKVPAKYTELEGTDRVSYNIHLCYYLCEIYKERHDTLTAVKYLLEIEKHWLYLRHYICIRGWDDIKLYKEILELYTVLNDKKGVAKYQEKIKTLEDKRK